VTEEEDVIALGALTRHHDIATSPVTLSSVPLLAHVAGQIGDPQVRHRGTIGGSICHGDPASDLAAVLLALGATFVAQVRTDGERSTPRIFRQFLRGGAEVG